MERRGHPARFSDRPVSLPPGPVNLSASAQLVAPAVVVKGTLSITASELYFEVDEDEPGFKAIDPKVRDSSSIDLVSNCHLLKPCSLFPHSAAKCYMQDLHLNTTACFISTSVVFLMSNNSTITVSASVSKHLLCRRRDPCLVSLC